MTPGGIWLAIPYLPMLWACGFAIFRWNRLSLESKAISRFLIFSTVVQLLSLYFWWNSQNNIPLLHLHTIVGYALLAFFYQEVLKGYLPTRILQISAGLFAVFAAVDTLWFQDIYSFNSHTLTVQSILIAILSLATYSLLLNQTVKTEKARQLQSLHWINSGLFIYFVSSLLLFYYSERINSMAIAKFRIGWTLHSLFATLLYVCLLVGLWKQSKN